MSTLPRPVRYRCELFARLEAQGAPVKVRVLELSETGAFVEEAPGFDEAQVDDVGHLTLALPGGEPWTGRFRVARLGTSRRELKASGVEHVTVAAQGYGLEFAHDDDDELERLRDFLELLDLR
ncbi:MAG: PilZ domain-containing protein [Myxococcaceae bacterium]|jgi:hypothetical protein|nr:PilZ domain-containing protein [Myxococcaceae bacterium]